MSPNRLITGKSRCLGLMIENLKSVMKIDEFFNSNIGVLNITNLAHLLTRLSDRSLHSTYPSNFSEGCDTNIRPERIRSEFTGIETHCIENTMKLKHRTKTECLKRIPLVANVFDRFLFCLRRADEKYLTKMVQPKSIAIAVWAVSNMSHTNENVSSDSDLIGGNRATFCGLEKDDEINLDDSSVDELSTCSNNKPSNHISGMYENLEINDRYGSEIKLIEKWRLNSLANLFEIIKDNKFISLLSSLPLEHTTMMMLGLTKVRQIYDNDNTLKVLKIILKENRLEEEGGIHIGDGISNEIVNCQHLSLLVWSIGTILERITKVDNLYSGEWKAKNRSHVITEVIPKECERKEGTSPKEREEGNRIGYSQILSEFSNIQLHLVRRVSSFMTHTCYPSNEINKGLYVPTPMMCISYTSRLVRGILQFVTHAVKETSLKTPNKRSFIMKDHILIITDYAVRSLSCHMDSKSSSPFTVTRSSSSLIQEMSNFLWCIAKIKSITGIPLGVNSLQGILTDFLPSTTMFQDIVKSPFNERATCGIGIRDFANINWSVTVLFIDTRWATFTVYNPSHEERETVIKVGGIVIQTLENCFLFLKDIIDKFVSKNDAINCVNDVMTERHLQQLVPVTLIEVLLSFRLSFLYHRLVDVLKKNSDILSLSYQNWIREKNSSLVSFHRNEDQESYGQSFHSKSSEVNRRVPKDKKEIQRIHWRISFVLAPIRSIPLCIGNHQRQPLGKRVYRDTKSEANRHNFISIPLNGYHILNHFNWSRMNTLHVVHFLLSRHSLIEEAQQFCNDQYFEKAMDILDSVRKRKSCDL